MIASTFLLEAHVTQKIPGAVLPEHVHQDLGVGGDGGGGGGSGGGGQPPT